MCYKWIALYFQHLQSLEQDLITTDDAAVPVYFAWETEEMREIYEDIYSSSSGDQAATAVEGMVK